MKTYGIRILDGEEDVLTPSLKDILEEISEKESLNWSILFLSGIPNHGYGEYLTEYEKKIHDSKDGYEFLFKNSRFC